MKEGGREGGEEGRDRLGVILAWNVSFYLHTLRAKLVNLYIRTKC